MYVITKTPYAINSASNVKVSVMPMDVLVNMWLSKFAQCEETYNSYRRLRAQSTIAQEKLDCLASPAGSSFPDEMAAFLQGPSSFANLVGSSIQNEMATFFPWTQ